jgi:hypothetical protein
MVLIEDPMKFLDDHLGLSLPLIVREDWGHGYRMLRVETDVEVRAVCLEDFNRPVAVEFIDVQGQDGLYRKYRSVVCGDICVPQSLHVSEDWRVHGSPSQAVYNEKVVNEEIDFSSKRDERHEDFVAASRALGLEFVAFDYSFDRSGDLVVWEANPFPLLHFLKGRRAYRNRSTERVLAGMTKLYLETAGVKVPRGLTEVLGFGPTRT